MQKCNIGKAENTFQYRFIEHKKIHNDGRQKVGEGKKVKFTPRNIILN